MAVRAGGRFQGAFGTVSYRDQLAAHLAFFEELGVSGVSRDPAWRTRPAERARTHGAESPAPGPQAAGPAAGAVRTDTPLPGPQAAGPAAGAVRTDAHSPGPQAGAPRGDAPLADPGAEVTASWRAASLWDPGIAAPADAPAGERLARIREELGDCTRCKLHGGRTHLVFGVGNPDADLMFVGEAPGRDEDLQGEPFVGRAGQLLTRIIEAIDLRREDVYIANVIKCRPPDNRNPERDEVETCRPFPLAQIDAIRPRVLVALGSFAVRTLLDDDRMPISRARGRLYACRGAKLVATFHPAFLLRSPERKRDVWEDMKRVRALLRGA